MNCKELCMDLITEYVISTKRIFGGDFETVIADLYKFLAIDGGEFDD